MSYAREDADFVGRLVVILETYGWSVWWDRRIAGGDQWDTIIENELAASKCALVVWSPASIDSRWVRTEANAALERKILVPITVSRAVAPLAFRLIQTTDFTGWSGEAISGPVFDLKRAIDRRLGANDDQSILERPPQVPTSSLAVPNDAAREIVDQIGRAHV